MIFAVSLPSVAGAHAFLVRTTPQAGERLAAGPSEIALRFSEPVVAGSEEIAIRTPEGRSVPVGPVERLDGGTHLRVTLSPLYEAIYIVTWHVLADDAHLSAGEFAFAVGPGGQLPATARSLSGAIAWPEAVASGLLLTGLVLAVGGLVSETIVWGSVARRHGFVLPPAPEDPHLLTRVIDTMRAQPKISMTERVSSGPGMTAGPYPVRFTGVQFVAQEVYAAGGAVDVRPLPAGRDRRVLILYLPGSAMWYRLEVDPQNRLQTETILNPGHLIERTFRYGPGAGATAGAETQ